jgi:hypothetical protein
VIDDDELQKIKERYLAEYQDNVRWLRGAIPRDDVYDFAEQTLMAAEFFLLKLAPHLTEAEKQNESGALCTWIRNIARLRAAKEEGFPGIVNVTVTLENIGTELPT